MDVDWCLLVCPQGLSVTEVTEGYEIASKKALELLPGVCTFLYCANVRRHWLGHCKCHAGTRHAGTDLYTGHVTQALICTLDMSLRHWLVHWTRHAGTDLYTGHVTQTLTCTLDTSHRHWLVHWTRHTGTDLYTGHVTQALTCTVDTSRRHWLDPCAQMHWFNNK